MKEKRKPEGINAEILAYKKRLMRIEKNSYKDSE